MQAEASADIDVLKVATEWCRQMAAAEPGGFACILAPDAVAHGLSPDGSVLRGPEAMQDYFATLGRLCRPTACEVLESVVQGDRATLRWIMRFQPGLGAFDTRHTEVGGMSMIVTRDQRIVEVWNTYGSVWI
jgi:hypothetical protein